ncbi:lysophospholipid acyltransferase family protein [Microvirga guangxiensis]|uniref:1-acyl-sn-glycerol-3-phosphate acyltransferase n=1 Tax=Microvirga guangxiensis TaxID=549386 RepID=A0A1G5EII1_9HYPH|nr:1-acyl-sn-glycerol-3-phosphate acyltransferase [Microvirga guangxiensis]SCY26775.1 1-acyl-sn-glycerol-3-phosphate acyltransferase [Microvirga guangxiensis]
MLRFFLFHEAMLFVRSLLFNVVFYAYLVLWLILLIPGMLVPRKTFIRMVQVWARSSLWLQRVIAGTRTEIHGVEKIPSGGALVAAKHQSLWETFALMTVFDDPTFILKRELMWLPFFGWYLWKAGCVPVNRKAGSAALMQMTARAREEAQHGRQIIIFPEGTRRPPGAPAAYKYGVAHLYQNLGFPCVPVGLNSGLYWPRRQFIRRPGTIRLEILEPIAPGLKREEFFRLVQDRIEESSNRLLAEGRRELGLGDSVGTPATSSTNI